VTQLSPGSTLRPIRYRAFSHAWAFRPNYDRQTWQQAKRLGEDPRDLKQIIQQAWAVSDNRASFESALERHALHLARGDRRGFVVVHHSGEPMSLTRYANLKNKDVEARIGKPEQLQTLDQVQSVLRARMTATAEKRLSDLKEKHRRELRPFADRAAQMRQTHQTERLALHTRQRKRQQREDLARANRPPQRPHGPVGSSQRQTRQSIGAERPRGCHQQNPRPRRAPGRH
jgi:hypothetical protein